MLSENAPRRQSSDDAERDAQRDSALTQAQKLELIGLLAGGIAHDFNNMLAVVLGQAGLLLNEAPLSARQRRRVEAIHDAAERGVGLTRKLLTFSRRKVVEARVFDLNVVILDLTKMLRRLIREDIELVTGLAPGIATIRGDPVEIEQVIINLAVNARDAMPQGGVVTIETATTEAGPTDARAATVVENGEFVVLRVTDTGSGMTDDVKAHLFEPFFTTKQAGQGTGLGLATVYRIIKQSGGELVCESEVGRGTAFTIRLPQVRTGATLIAARWVDGELPRGTETVLLVEDDGDIREIALDILATQGYSVLDAADADQALQLSRSHRGALHLLLTDVVMPRMGGQKLAEQLLATRPEMKVLYVSGHADDVIFQLGGLHGELALLRKPFTPLRLVQKVREVLDGLP